MEVFWVGFGGSNVFWGGRGGSKGVNSTPMGRVLPLGKSCTAPKLVPNTTLWFNWPSLTGYASLTQCIAMLDLWDPSKDPQKTTLWANESLSEPQKVPKFHINGPFYLWWPYILSIIWHLGPNLVTLGHLNLISRDLFSGRKARFWTICVPKGLDLLKKWPFEGP